MTTQTNIQIAIAAREFILSRRDYYEKLFAIDCKNPEFMEVYGNSRPIYTATAHVIRHLNDEFIGRVAMKATRPNIIKAGFLNTGVKTLNGGCLNPIVVTACKLMENDAQISGDVWEINLPATNIRKSPYRILHASEIAYEEFAHKMMIVMNALDVV